MLFINRLQLFFIFSFFIFLSLKGVAQNYDLSIEKVVDYTLPALNGNDIPFNITVTNLGDDVQNIIIEDNIPLGYTFNSLLNPGWSNTPPNVTYLLSGALISGASTMVTLELTMDTIAEPSNMMNKSSILSFDDALGNPEIDNDLSNNIDSAAAPIFDLALRKTIVSAPYKYGEPHVFKLMVYNQGNITAQNVELKEFIAQGYYYLQAANPGWSTGPDPTYTFIDPLVAGDSQSVNITLYLLSGDGGINFWSNRAGIWNANDDMGINRNVWDFDSEYGTNEAHETAVLMGSDFDNKIDGRSLLNDPITGFKILNLSEDEDDHDVASPEIFDLALRTLQQTAVASFSYGSFVGYDIEVYNQGNVPAKNITIIDTVPCGLLFDQAASPNWTYDPVTRKASTIIAGPLLGDEIYTETFQLRVDTCFSHLDDRWFNYKEIKSAMDTTDVMREDIDSTPDDIFTNDFQGFDNEIDEDGKNHPDQDEDDNDPHAIEIVDLALKTTIPNDIPYHPGDTVAFSIKIYNQGNITLQDIHVKNYMTSSYTFNGGINPGWNNSGGNDYTYIFPGQLGPRDSAEVFIKLVIDNFDDIENYAEVESVRDHNFTGRNDDADSQVNTDSPEERSVHSGDADDDNLMSLGLNYFTGPQDQDDHDPASPQVIADFDLSLTKTHRPLGADISYGDDIVYDIVVTNEGEIEATLVVVTDKIPCGLLFNQASNPNWIYDGVAKTATYNIPSAIEVGTDTTLVFTLELQPCDTDLANAWFNSAEIIADADDIGGPIDDVDSTPDNDIPSEDDQDNDLIPAFDLSISKNHIGGNSYELGDTVSYELIISNEGNGNASNIELVETLPCGLSFDASLNPTWFYDGGTNTATKTYTGVVAPGVSVTENIQLIIIACNDAGAFVNSVEIVAATDEMGGPVDDLDSTPDNDDPTEDDQDEDTISVNQEFDLSLSKTHQSLPMDKSYGDTVTFEIEIVNEGDITANNIMIKDIFGLGYEFSSTLNSDWVVDSIGAGGADSIASYIYTVTDPLLGGESVSVEFKLILSKYEDWDWTTYLLSNVFLGYSIPTLFNSVEIISAEDGNGNLVTDIDSSPDNFNDGINPMSVITIQEDDEGLDSVFIQDLSIVKLHDDIGNYAVGGSIAYHFRVYNYGNIKAEEVELLEYIPCGLSFDQAKNPSWTYDASTNTATKTVGPILAHNTAFRQFGIELDIIACTEDDAYVNIVEINSSNYANGDPIDDMDSTPGNGVLTEDDMAFDTINVVLDFDLSVSKSHSPLPSDISYGDPITYDILVTNEGDISATDIVLTEYVPCGLVFVAGSNSGWIYDAALTTATYTINSLTAGTDTTVAVTMNLVPCDPINEDSWRNEIEITSSNDTNGDPIDDVDSTPDNQDLTEDDMDDDSLDIFDLSMEKNKQGSSASFSYGQDIYYEHIITNEGNVDATSVLIEDRIPCGLSFDQSANLSWSFDASSNTAYKIVSLIEAGTQSVQVIILKLIPCYNDPATAWLNIAEIMEANDPSGDPANDVDSTPGNGDLDEDDQDDLDVEVIDLAAIVEVVNDIDYYIGDTVTYRFTVYNQGNVPTTDIVLNDYMGGSYLFLADNPGWTDNGGVLNYTIPSLDPDNSITVDVKLKIESDVETENYGEVKTVKDDNGITRDDDADSQSNSDTPAERSIYKGHEDDNNIFSLGLNGPYGVEDQDDHDPGNITLLIDLGAIGNFVWNDEDGDGIQDVNEPGISGAVVELYNQNKILLRSVITDGNGYYLIDDIDPGTYYLLFPTPDLYTDIAIPYQGNDTNKDSDIDNSNGLGTTPLITVSSGENDFSWDAGFFQCVRIGDNVWLDYNENDLFDGYENGINGITVNLYKKVGNSFVLWDSQETGQKPGSPSDDGWYEFCSTPGIYYIEVDLPPYGLVPAKPNIGNNDNIDSDITNANGYGTTSNFTVYAGSNKLDIGAGYYEMGSIGDKVWIDSDGDGYQDKYESGAPNVSVDIYSNSGHLVYSTITDVDGKYNLEYLQKGDYYLKFTPPSNFGMTVPNDAGENFDSDVDHSNGLNTTSTYHIEPGDRFPNIDAGIIFGVLPVEFVSVKADNKGDYNLVSWEVASEFNVDHYEIEVRHYTEKQARYIGSVDPHNVFSTIQSYSLQDLDIDRVGLYYYRIKAVDNDGSHSYSKFVSVELENNETLLMNFYPNPTVRDINLQYSLSNDAKVNIMIYDISGKTVVKELLNEYRLAGEYNEQLSVMGINKGTYIVQVRIEDKVYNKPIIILGN